MAEATTAAEPNPQDVVAKAAAASTVDATEAKTLVEGAAQETEESTILGEEKKEEKVVVAETVLPEKYEFKVPEGMEIDQKLVETVTPIFKDLKLSQEQAQKLVDAYAPYVKTQVEAQQQKAIADYKGIINEWKTETQKELGADADKKLAVAAKALNKFGTPELRELFNETGVGNHKALVNFMVKVGTMISEDSFAEPNKASTSGADDLSILYPTMKK